MANASPGSKSPVLQPLAQQFFEGPTVQPAEHLVQRGYAGGALPGEAQRLRYLLALVSSPLTDGVQAAGPAQHGADGQPKNRPQRMSTTVSAARVRQPSHHIQQRQFPDVLSFAAHSTHSPMSSCLYTTPVPSRTSINLPTHFRRMIERPCLSKGGYSCSMALSNSCRLCGDIPWQRPLLVQVRQSPPHSSRAASTTRRRPMRRCCASGRPVAGGMGAPWRSSR